MKALIKEGGRVRCQTIPVPALTSSDEVRIRVMAAGVCRTDLYVALDQVSTPEPIVLGHEFSGVVEAKGPAVRHVRVGDAVTVHPWLSCDRCRDCLAGEPGRCANARFLGVDRDGAFAEQVVVPGRAVYPLPRGLSFREGAFAEPVAASLAVRRAALSPGARGLIFGAGRIAVLTQRILAACGMGEVPIHPADGAPLEPDSCDFIIETIATTEALAAMLDALRPGGTLVLKSRQMALVSLRLASFLRKEPVLRVVHYGSFAEALALLGEGRVRVDDLLGDSYPIEAFGDVFARAEADEAMKLFFTMSLS